MNDIEQINVVIAGLQERGKLLNSQKELFISAESIDRAIAENNVELASVINLLSETKESLGVAEQARRDSIGASVSQMSSAMSEVLPEGFAPYIADDGGGIRIGLMVEGNAVPHAGLSGGQEQIFKAALEYAMMPKSDNRLLIVEAGEIDSQNLKSFLDNISSKNPKAQIIVNTWHIHEDDIGLCFEDRWKIVELNNEKPSESADGGFV